MKRVITLLSLAASFVLLAGVETAIQAQSRRGGFGGACGPGGCGINEAGLSFAVWQPNIEPAARSQPQPLATRWEWRSAADLPGGDSWRLLLKDGNAVGGWNVPGGYYQSWLGGDSWGERTEHTPYPVPAELLKLRVIGMPKDAPKDQSKPAKKVELVAFQPDAPTENYGIDWDRVSKTPRISLSGQTINIETALDLIQQNKVPDDSKKFRLVVIGNDAERKRVTDAFATLEISLRDRIAVWSVPPNHWSLKDLSTNKVMYATDGAPSVYCQGPDGKVLHRQAGFADAGDLEAIRKAIKGYDSAKDPDLRKTDPKKSDPANSGDGTVPMLLVGGAGVLAYLFFRRNE